MSPSLKEDKHNMFDVRLIIISLKYIQKNPFQIKKKTHITQTAQKEKNFFSLNFCEQRMSSHYRHQNGDIRRATERDLA